jgi:hypothetical protein
VIIDLDAILNRLAVMRDRGSSRRPRNTTCPRCGDSGLLELDQRVDDSSLPGGYRFVPMAYRCECPAGARYQKFVLAPPAERPLRLLRGDDPKD